MWLSFKSIEELAGLELLELVVELEDGPDSVAYPELGSRGVSKSRKCKWLVNVVFFLKVLLLPILCRAAFYCRIIVGASNGVTP